MQVELRYDYFLLFQFLWRERGTLHQKTRKHQSFIKVDFFDLP